MRVPKTWHTSSNRHQSLSVRDNRETSRLPTIPTSPRATELRTRSNPSRRAEAMAALSPDITPQNYSFPPKGSGLKPRDAIIAVNGVMTKTRSEVVPHLIGKPDQKVTVRIRRKNIEQDVTMSFKPWLECDGNIFYYEQFFFHFEYADNIVPGRR